MTYVLITPARNEIKFLELTIRSVVNQTVTPVKWIIVSDGSTDGTDELVENYAKKFPWIELVRMPLRSDRSFSGKAVAFNEGFTRVRPLSYDVIGNLDGDVSFEPDYLEFLLSKFAEDHRLGVAGTPYKEENQLHNEQFKSPEHVSGACQLFRRACLEEIGGYPLVKSGGIDLIALLSAQAKGWRTRRFDERFCWHHRNVGSGMHEEVYSRLLNLGRKDHLLGSHPVFEFFRALNQMRSRPYILGGVLMLVGYFSARLRGVPCTMPADLIAIRQRDQLKRLRAVLLFEKKQKNAGADGRSENSYPSIPYAPK